MSSLSDLFKGKTQEEWADEAGSGKKHVFPPGWTGFTLIRATAKLNKNEDGLLILLEWQSDCQNNYDEYLNISNKSEVSERIGRANFAKRLGDGGRKIPEVDLSPALAGTDTLIPELSGMQADLKMEIIPNKWKDKNGVMREGKKNNVITSARYGTESRKEKSQQQQGPTGSAADTNGGTSGSQGTSWSMSNV